MKSAILERLGETDVLLPSLIAAGLAANDRVKLRLSVLQAAAAHARDQSAPAFDLADECRRVGLDATAIESLVTGASETTDARLTAPGLGLLAQGIWTDAETMAHAVAAGRPADAEAAERRMLALKQGTGTLGGDDIVTRADIDQLIRLDPGDSDSLHRLVVDLHRSLNQLAGEHAEEVIDGARVYGLLPQDRPLVSAFTRGLESTQQLKFGHPGLATTVVRSGAHLSIQNDIGETDAHVLVITIEDGTITITHTDVHRPRARFFTELLAEFPIEWRGLEPNRAEGLAESSFLLLTGSYAADAAATQTFLEAVGASLVFLIDLNRARKVLQMWVAKGDAMRVLLWAARHRFGHRAFLELGGGELVASAVRDTASNRIGFGDRLDTVIGRAGAVDFLKAVLRIAALTLLEGSSPRQARDRIEVDLAQRLKRADAALLAIAVRQAGLAREIAADVARLMGELQAGRAAGGKAVAARARRIEEKADRIAGEARAEIARLNADPAVQSLVDRLEDTIDELEQAAFISSLIPAGVPADLVNPLAALAAAAVAGTEAAAKGAVAAAAVPEGHRVDSDEVLVAVDRLLEAEHVADAAERATTATALARDLDFRVALSVLEAARAIERATDRLAGFGHRLRDHVVAELTG